LPISLDISHVIPISCFGKNDGKVAIKGLPINIYSHYDNNVLKGLTDTFINLTPGNHTFKLQNAAGCFSDTILNIFEPAVLNIWVTDSIDINCKGDANGEIKVKTTGGNLYPYFYTLNETSFLRDSVYKNLKTGYYEVKVVDKKGCTDSVTVHLFEPDSSLSISLVSKEAMCYYTDDGQFKMSVFGGTRPYKSSLDPSVFSFNGVESIHMPYGMYLISILDANGCKLDTTQFIDVQCCIASLPNAFTPNNDGLNDYFNVSNPNDFERIVLFEIFNRYGQLVYSNKDKTTLGWDGQYLGKDQEVGTFVYHLVIGCSKGRINNYKGNVTLVK
jgi:gliding motility-associated-like protein